MSFFSRSVLCTEQDDVAPYMAPLMDLLLAVDHRRRTGMNRKDWVYCKWVHLLGPRGERIRVQAVIDGGAMKNEMADTTTPPFRAPPIEGDPMHSRQSADCVQRYMDGDY